MVEHLVPHGVARFLLKLHYAPGTGELTVSISTFSGCRTACPGFSKQWPVELLSSTTALVANPSDASRQGSQRLAKALPTSGALAFGPRQQEPGGHRESLRPHRAAVTGFRVVMSDLQRPSDLENLRIRLLQRMGPPAQPTLSLPAVWAQVSCGHDRSRPCWCRESHAKTQGIPVISFAIGGREDMMTRSAPPPPGSPFGSARLHCRSRGSDDLGDHGTDCRFCLLHRQQAYTASLQLLPSQYPCGLGSGRKTGRLPGRLGPANCAGRCASRGPACSPRHCPWAGPGTAAATGQRRQSTLQGRSGRSLAQSRCCAIQTIECRLGCVPKSERVPVVHIKSAQSVGLRGSGEAWTGTSTGDQRLCGQVQRGLGQPDPRPQ